MTSKLGINSKKELNKAWFDFLWATLIKAIAGFKSEISGETENLQAHHLAGKPNLWLRYLELDNGFCCTSGQHNFGFHHAGRVEAYREYAKKLRGKDIYERLELLKNKHEKISLIVIEEFLLGQLAGFNEKIIDYYQSQDYKSPIVKKQYEKLFAKISQGQLETTK